MKKLDKMHILCDLLASKESIFFGSIGVKRCVVILNVSTFLIKREITFSGSFVIQKLSICYTEPDKWAVTLPFPAHEQTIETEAGIFI